jgi:HAD superfamily hydrolase (TIGR01549 family)
VGVGAIIWDYDGTLVDTREKNFNVTRKVVEKIAHTNPLTFQALRTLDAYTKAHARSVNWRDFYEREFGFSQDLIDEAGRAWSALQSDDPMPISVFDGIHLVLHQLRDLRHGIVSQNSRSAITRVLDGNDLRHYFSFIVGYEEVDLRRQKPAPDGLLQCIDGMMQVPAGRVLYIGDHETDAVCARNANELLRRTSAHIHIASVGALYSSGDSVSNWSIKPDYEARTVQDIVSLVESLSNMADGCRSSVSNPPP